MIYTTSQLIHAINFRHDWMLDAIKQEDWETATQCATAIQLMVEQLKRIKQNGLDKKDSKN